ncbi:MAG: GNAT family N-acetyltransferase [Chitinophagaceae bacterium]
MTLILESERLLLREFSLEDAPFIIELLNSPGWIKYIGERQVKTNEQAAAYLQNGPLKSYQQNGYGFYMVQLKTDGTPVGMCGLIKRPFLPHPDIGFAFLPAYNGKGYAYEIASATAAFAKTTLQIEQLAAIVMAENESSIRLLQKLHFQFHSTITYPDTGEDLLLYTN